MCHQTPRSRERGLGGGGRAGSKFFKALRLQPAPQAQGRRMNADDTELLQLGLQLERQLQRHLRNRWLPVNRQPELPPGWVGFRRPDARDIQGDGPELAAACRQRRKSPKQLLASTACTLIDSASGPLDWSRLRGDTPEKLAQLIEAKLEGREVAAFEEEPVQVLQLLDALKQSVAQAAGKKASPGVKNRSRKRRTA